MPQELIPSSADDYRLLLEAHPNPVLLYEIDSWRLLAFNKAATTFYGWSRAEMDAMTVLDVWPPDDRAQLMRVASESPDSVSRVSAGRHVARDGRVLDVRVTTIGVTLPEGRRARLSVVEDHALATQEDARERLDERHRAQRALRESEARFARLFNSDLVMAAVIDTERGVFRDVNKAWLRFFGRSREEIVGLPLTGTADVWLNAAQHDIILSRCKAGVPIIDVETGFRTPLGPRYAKLSVHYSREAAEDIVVMVDITERRRLEGQLSEARRLEALGRLAGGVAHDFNNMLVVMSGYADLLETQLPPATEALANLREIQQAAARATDLTRQLLAFGRRQMQEPQQVDLSAVVRDTSTFLRRVLGEDVALQIALSDEPLWVSADASQIEQVLSNLVSNARDALDGAGVVYVSAKARTLAKSWAQERALPPGRAAELSVRDTGRGMDAATLQRVFDPFFTTKNVGQGTGLGLATVYGIVKQSGGHIDAASTPGQGSLFRVILPLVDPPLQGVADAPAPETEGGSETILVVEDEPSVATLASSLLENLGYCVLTAHSAADAVTLASQHDGSIDLLLTDVVLPATSGRELAEQMSAARPRVKVLYMSGYPSEAIIRRGIGEGDVAFLAKPFTATTLAAAVRQALGR